MLGARRLLVVVGTTLGIGLTPAVAWAKDYASIARDIMPSGEYGSVPPPANAAQQAMMYDGLTPLFRNVSSADVTRFFKPEPVGTSGAAGPLTNEPVPRAGVTIQRDAYDVPYIRGVTRDDVTWGAGWVTAEDRGLLLQQARYNSRVAAIDVPGLHAIGLITGLKQFQPSPQTEQEVNKQTGVLLAAGAKGRDVLHDIDLYDQGINAYYSSTHQNIAPFTRTDIYALNALKGQFVGQGGGKQALNAELLSTLKRRFGRKRGFSVWNDLREANDPEAPVSLPGTVQFQPPPRSLAGNVTLDPGSLSLSARQTLAGATDVPASNILMVSGARSANHHPIMVAGPQLGYDYPGLTDEMDLEGPGIHQHGASSAPLPGYILIGRSQDQAWTLTSAALDIIDTYAETLCGHSRHRYLFDGRCRAMQLFDAGSLNGQELTFYRTVHGPVIGYARVHGRLVALSRKRSSYGRDVRDLLFYHDLAHGLVHTFDQFRRAASQTPQTFNSFYMDDRDIGEFTSGLIPIRPANVDQDLPVDGRGREEWRGFVAFADHPQGVNPPGGEIINWNNRTQAGYEAPDDQLMYGAAHRVQLLIRDLPSRGLLTPARIVGAMNEAATQDVREMTLEPVLSKLLHGTRAPSVRDAQMLRLLDAWRGHGGSRLDRTGNGQITDPGAAIMDTAWPLVANAWESTVLGPGLRSALSAVLAQFDPPFSGPVQPAGREQYHGWYGWMDKDLRTILGEPVTGPFAARYCGGGNLKRCRNQLWNAVDRAGQQLARQQGSDPTRWRSSATAERIKFVPGLLTYTMRYTNRPTGIQQVLSFRGHVPGDG